MSKKLKFDMKLAIKKLERTAANIEGEDIPCFRGIPATDFDKEHLVMLCAVFCNEWHKARMKYLQAAGELFPNYIAGANATCTILYKPSRWRKAWNRLQRKLRPPLASSTPDSAQDETKTSAKA